MKNSIFILFVFIAVSSCNQKEDFHQEEDNYSQSSDVASDQSGDMSFEEQLSQHVKGSADVSIPSSINEALCSTDNNVHYTECDWLLASDAIIVGVVEKVEHVGAPYLSPSPSQEIVVQDTCSSPSYDDSLVFTLSIQLYLKPEGNPNDLLQIQGSGEIDLRVGPYNTATWRPVPYSDEGQVKWIVSELSTDNVGPLEVGQTIGVFARHVEKYNFWTNTGTPIFAVGSNNEIFPQKINFCGRLNYMEKIESIDRLVSKYSACLEDTQEHQESDGFRFISTLLGNYNQEMHLLSFCRDL